MDSQLLLRMVLVLACIFFLFALVSHFNRGASGRLAPLPEPFERFTGRKDAMDAGSGSLKKTGCGAVQGVDTIGGDSYRPLDYEVTNKLPTDCMPRDRLTAEDLLPRDAVDSKWAQVNPAGQGSVGDMNLLQAGVHIGNNTVQGSLRLANYDLRAAPIVEQKQVSPWNQTTVVPDNNMKPLL